MGSNKVMQIALGKTPEDEYRPELYNLSKVFHIAKGNAGTPVLGLVSVDFTCRNYSELEDYFSPMKIISK